MYDLLNDPVGSLYYDVLNEMNYEYEQMWEKKGYGLIQGTLPAFVRKG
jgi:hypothetical protein